MKIPKSFSKSRATVFGIVFAVIGVVALVSSFAASPEDTRVFEAESASTSGKVAFQNDTNASGGSYVEFGLEPTGNLASSLTQDGITWTFDRSYKTGQYINGDYWVEGPVTITDISPNWTGTKNGSDINPFPGQAHGYHSLIPGYGASENIAEVTLGSGSVVLNGGDSLVSTIGWVSSDPGAPPLDASIGNGVTRPALRAASILTVVNSAPSDNSFRPQYAGGTKTTHNGSQMDLSLLPSYPVLSSAPTVTDANNSIRKVMIDTVPNWTGRIAHPSENMAAYGRDLASQMNEASLVLMLDHTTTEKRDLAISLIQRGIDLHGILETVTSRDSWGYAKGGHGVGRKWPILFAGIMLDDPTMKSIGSNYGHEFFSEDCAIELAGSGYNAVAWTGGGFEWGHALCSRSGSPPGNPSYRYCCQGNVNNAAILSARLMDPTSGAIALWNHDTLFDYTDYYMNDSSLADSGRGWTAFIRNMWDTYR